MSKLVFYFLCFVIVIMLAEFAVRKSEKFATRTDKNGNHHNPSIVTERLEEPWLMGTVGPLPPLNKEKNEYRIVAMGDSSTVGSDDEEALGFVGRLAQKYSNTRKTKYTFINGGVSGSDPVFELELLKRRLLNYKPDLVLFLINPTDITDFKRRGGLDRFKEDGQLKDVLPAWTPLFNASHLVRAFVLQVLDYNWQLKPRSQERQELNSAIDGLIDTFKAVHQLATEKKFKILALLEPTAEEVAKRKFPPFFANIEKDLSNSQVDVANLLPNFLEKIPVEKTEEYFWPINGHFNSKGYEVFFQAVQSELKRRGI